MGVRARICQPGDLPARIERTAGVRCGRIFSPVRMSCGLGLAIPTPCPMTDKGAAQMAAETPSAQTILYVCSTCRAGVAPIEGQPVAGARLLAALQDAHEASSVDAEDKSRLVIRAVECLSACSRGCAIALARPGSWTYIYGNLSEADVADILLGAQGYIASADGIPPWRERPVIFRKQCVARIPPQEIAP